MSKGQEFSAIDRAIIDSNPYMVLGTADESGHPGVTPVYNASADYEETVQALWRSPDGTKLASCGDDGAIMLWDIHSGEHLQTVRRDRPYERLNITGIKGLTDAQKATLRALGATENIE